MTWFLLLFYLNCLLSSRSPNVNNTIYDSVCQTDHTKEECSKCNLCFDLFSVIEGFLMDREMLMGFTKHEVDLMYVDFQQARNDIEEWIRFIVRNHAQNSIWEDLFSQKQESLALVTADWVRRYYLSVLVLERAHFSLNVFFIFGWVFPGLAWIFQVLLSLPKTQTIDLKFDWFWNLSAWVFEFRVARSSTTKYWICCWKDTM